MDTKVTYSLGEHRNQKVIFIRFERDLALTNWVKSLTGAKWSRTQKSWYVIDNEQYRIKFNLPRNAIGTVEATKIPEANHEAYRAMQEMLILKAYSPNTMRTYLNEFAQLLHILKDFKVEDLTEDRLRIKTLKLLS